MYMKTKFFIELFWSLSLSIVGKIKTVNYIESAKSLGNKPWKFMQLSLLFASGIILCVPPSYFIADLIPIRSMYASTAGPTSALKCVHTCRTKQAYTRKRWFENSMLIQAESLCMKSLYCWYTAQQTITMAEFTLTLDSCCIHESS